MGRTKDEVVLRDFAIADLLLERVRPVVHVDVQPYLREFLSDLGGILPLYSMCACKQPATSLTVQV